MRQFRSAASHYVVQSNWPVGSGTRLAAGTAAKDDAETGAGLGATVGGICDGRDVMEALWALDPALVILDCNLRGRTGMAVLEEIRTSAPNCAVPVMMLTGRKGN